MSPPRRYPPIPLLLPHTSPRPQGHTYIYILGAVLGIMASLLSLPKSQTKHSINNHKIINCNVQLAMERADLKSGGKSSGGGGDGGDKEMMVTFELEAAEALACLAAHSSDNDDFDVDGDGDHSGQLCDSDHRPPDYGARVVNLQVEVEHTQKKNKTVSDPMKIDDEHEQEQHQQLCCSTSFHATSAGRSRQPLTETEKEARRLRRVLANRESARQTIRRRQAMFEELTRKASDLTLENHNLKTEKELAVKEYDSLANTNNCLKEQMAKLEATEAGEIRKLARSVPKEYPSSASASTLFFPYDQPPLVPIPWHSLMQPAMQGRSQNDNATPSVFPMPYMFPDQRNTNAIPSPGGGGALVYVLPLPCFYPLSSSSNEGIPQSSNPIERQIDAHTSNQCNTGSSCESSLPFTINRESYGQAMCRDDHLQAGFGIPPERRHKSGGGTETDPKRTVLVLPPPPPLNCVRHNVTSQLQEGSGEEAVVGSVTGNSSAVSVTEDGPEAEAHIGRKALDASASAKARRRRRELMKLRNIHPGQFAVN